jgi:3-phenylpropionate/trans-cinnamate dioxygenase ferredoxin subunit
MPQFIKVATTAELADQQAKLVEVEGQKIALFRVDGGFYALSDTCTHRRGPLSEGTVEGAEVACPWHGAKFDVRTGAVLGPPAGQAVKRLEDPALLGEGRISNETTYGVLTARSGQDTKADQGTTIGSEEGSDPESLRSGREGW